MFSIKNLKLPLVAALVLLLACPAAEAQQNVRISVRDTKISAAEAMKSIESQTAYRFSYNKNIYDPSRMLDLPHTTLPLGEILKSMVDGADVKYMVHGYFIALVPANDNSRPQVRVRTSDVYVPNKPEELSAAPVPMPVVERAEVVQQAEAAPVPTLEPELVPVPEPEKELYSDYRPIEVYGDVQTSQPRFGLKVNVLYGLSTLTPNIAAEAAISKRSTIALSYSYNAWKYKANLDDNTKLLHGIAALEYRYWFCERYSGHLLGARVFYSEYNVSGRNIPTLFSKDYRYKGNAYGGGVFYGYALPIAKMWNIEFTGGLNVTGMDYDRYGCRTCDTDSKHFKKVNLSPSAGINIVFLIR